MAADWGPSAVAADVRWTVGRGGGRPSAVGFSRQCSRNSVAHVIGSGFAAASAASGSACRWMMLNCSSLNAIGFGEMAGPLCGLNSPPAPRIVDRHGAPLEYQPGLFSQIGGGYRRGDLFTDLRRSARREACR